MRFVPHTKLWKLQPFFRTWENVWPSISCLFQTIRTFTEEDCRCDWFRMSHKRYRNFTEMSAKSLNATNTGCLPQQSLRDKYLSRQNTTVKCIVESVLKRRVQFCLIASLAARVHGKVHSLSKSTWLVLPVTEQSYYCTNSIKICIIYHLCEERFHVDWGGN